jgi:hypothetical protein
MEGGTGFTKGELMAEGIEAGYRETAEGRVKLLRSMLPYVKDYVRLAREGHHLFSQEKIRAAAVKHADEIEKLLGSFDGTEAYDRAGVEGAVRELRGVAES